MPAFPRVKKAGRPSKLTKEVVDKMLNILRAGAYVETAAVLAGIPKSTFYEWMKQGRDKDGNVLDNEYGRFLDAVLRAMEECTARDLYNIDKCAMGQKWEYERDEEGKLILNGRGNPIVKQQGIAPDWRANAWRLERKHPEHWGLKDNKSSDSKGESVQVVVTIPSNGREVREND